MATMTARDAWAMVQRAVEEKRLTAESGRRIKAWLEEPPFEPYRKSLMDEIAAGRWNDLDFAFYTTIEFGTGGRRGLMYPVGTNVLNERTIAESARGLADFLAAKLGDDAPRSCAIARDARRNSKEFAECCARVLAAAGVKVHFFREPRSTPLLSFAVRDLDCDAGIMITASHNPPTDNGFKCYAATGGQVIPPDDKAIIRCVYDVANRAIPEISLDQGRAEGLVIDVGSDVDERFIAAVLEQSVSDHRDVAVVYTPMQGVGDTACGAALRAAKFRSVNVLASQKDPDPEFSNVPGQVANPEVPKTLEPAIAEAKRSGADVVIASDPDADRIGVAVPIAGDPSGDWTTLTGNQIGALLTDFVVRTLKAAGRLPDQGYVVTTLVSTAMTRAIAESEGVPVEGDLLVGFKWIADRMDKAGPERFVFGFEESHGYLRGTHVRDKDAAVAALLFAELVADLKAAGTNVLEHLDTLYQRHGHFGEHLINVKQEGRAGQERIARIMAGLRTNPPTEIAGLPVLQVRDYKEHRIIRPGRGQPDEPLPEPSGDLLIFDLDAPDTRFAARPSGTEPKIKFYLFAWTDPKEEGLERAKTQTRDRLDLMARAIQDEIARMLQDG